MYYATLLHILKQCKALIAFFKNSYDHKKKFKTFFHTFI